MPIPVEDFGSLGDSWGPAKAALFHSLVDLERYGPKKSSVYRIAQRASTPDLSISEEFVASLMRATRSDYTYRGRSRAEWTNHEFKRTAAVLAYLGWTPQRFLDEAARRAGEQ